MNQTPDKRSAARILVWACWAHVPFFAIVGYLIDGQWIGAAIASLIAAAMAETTLRLAPTKANDVVAVALIAQPAIGVGLLAGHPWQVDAHMYFFAMVAALAMMSDVRAIVIATVFVAVHHLSLNFGLSALIYPGGTDLARTVFHAFVLLLESAAIILTIRDRNTQKAASVAAAQEAEQSARTAREASATMIEAQESARATRENMMKTLADGFGSVVRAAAAGQFDKRVDTDFDDEGLRSLANDFNALLADVEGEISTTAKVISAYANGDLASEVCKDRTGIYAQLADAIGVLRSQLQEREVLSKEAEAEAVQRAEKAAIFQTFEEQLDNLVEKALAGDFTGVLDIDPASDLHPIASRTNQFIASFAETITDISTVVGSIAGGDLTARMQGQYAGDLKNLQDEVSDMANRLSDLTGEIAATADQIRSAQVTISRGADDLSSRNSAQAAVVEETNATMETLSRLIGTNTAKLADMQKISGSTAQTAVRGENVAQTAMETIKRVEESSNKINEITTMVNDIAFQTNLLALNAGVEAARAGESGKGFAVVAQEVATLANRASEASDQISNLLTESAVHVTDGVKFVTETGETLVDIRSAASEVVSALSDISEASADQSAQVSSIAGTVSSLDRETQSNSVLAADSVKEAQRLAALADRLTGLVSAFSTDVRDRNGQNHTAAA